MYALCRTHRNIPERRVVGDLSEGDCFELGEGARPKARFRRQILLVGNCPGLKKGKGEEILPNVPADCVEILTHFACKRLALLSHVRRAAALERPFASLHSHAINLLVPVSNYNLPQG